MSPKAHVLSKAFYSVQLVGGGGSFAMQDLGGRGRPRGCSLKGYGTPDSSLYRQFLACVCDNTGKQFNTHHIHSKHWLVYYLMSYCVHFG